MQQPKRPYNKIVSKKDNTNVVIPKIVQPYRGDGWDHFMQTSSPEKIMAMEEMLKKYGNPSINLAPEKARATYSGSKNSMTIEKNYFSGGDDQIIAELAHSKQYSSKGILPLRLKSIYENLMYGENRYSKKGTLEYEAHTEIEPKLKEEYRNLTYDKASKKSNLDIMNTKKNKYALGDFVKPMGGANSLSDFSGLAGMAGNTLGAIVGGEGGKMLSGIGSGAAAGMALGPLGAAGGAALGAIGAFIGNKAEEKRLTKQQKAQQASFNTAYQDQLTAGLDTVNDNPYGQVFANGGIIDPTVGYGAFNQKTKVGTVARKQMTKQELDYVTNKTGLKNNQFNDNLPVVEKYLTQYRSGVEPVGTPQPDRNNAFTMNADGTRNAGVYNHKMGMFNYAKYAEGGDVIPSIINIEKGELQIDPNSGKILREYKGINPETGGLYEPHSKGKDTKNNIVTAEPDTFIITKKKAKIYKDSIDNNDKIAQDTILQNISNYKRKNGDSEKMALGGGIDPWNQISQNNQLIMMGQKPGTLTGSPIIANTGFKPQGIPNTITDTRTSTFVPSNTGTNADFNWQGLGDGLAKFAPSLLNIGKGLFGKVDQVNQVGVTKNPYKQDILSNMPQDINFEPVRQQILRQQNSAFNSIDNGTSASPVARANKQNIYANTQNTLGKLAMDSQMNNNQIRSQRAGIYSNLGNQEIGAIDRAQQINLGIDEQNRVNQSAKDNLLTTGMNQLQQTYLNDKTNRKKGEMDEMQLEALKQMFPSIIPYLGNITKRR